MVLGTGWPRDGKNRDHIPHANVLVVVIRVCQGLLATLVMALTAFAVSDLQNAGNFTIKNWTGIEGYPLSWFTFAWTFVYLGWLLASLWMVPRAYNYWAHLSLECLTVVFWLVTFALLADHAVDLANLYGLSPFTSSTYRRLFNQIKGFVYGTYGAAAIAGITWASFILTLLLLSFAIHRHRRSNSPATPSTLPPGTHPHHVNVTFPHGSPTHSHIYPPQPSHQMQSMASVPQMQHAHQSGGSPYQPSPHYPPQGSYYSPSAQQTPPVGPGMNGHPMPAQNYGMYQQQVPIAPQPTGTSTFSSPQSPPPPMYASPILQQQQPQAPPLGGFQTVPPQQQQQQRQAFEKGAGVAYGQDVPNDPARIGVQELPAGSPTPAPAQTQTQELIYPPPAQTPGLIYRTP